MLTWFPEFIKAISLLVALAVTIVFLEPSLKRPAREFYREIVTGLLFSIIVVLGMLDPIELSSGAVFDPRGGPLLLAGVFGGPISAAIAGVLSALSRYYLVGGDMAVAGALSCIVYTLFGAFAGFIVRQYNVRLNILNLTVMSLLATVMVLPTFFLNHSLSEGVDLIRQCILMLIMNNVGSTIVIGMVMSYARKMEYLKEELSDRNHEDMLLSLVARNTTNAVVITDSRGNIEWVNDSFTRISGYNLDEVIGRKPGDFLHGPKTNPQSVDYINAQLAKGEGYQAELINYRRDGTPYWVEIFCQPVESPGEPIRYMAVESETTLRKAALERASHAEQVLLTALNTIEDGFVLYDKDDRLVLANDKYREIYNISGEAMTLGTRFEDILRYGAKRGQYKDAVGRVEEWVEERMQDHRAGNTDLVQELGDGRWLRIAERKTPDGGTVGLRIDITELKKAQSDAEMASKAKSEFLASMSHEIRTPMTGVMGIADMLLDDNLPKESADKVLQIKGATQSLLSILNDILDVSKLDAGRMVLENITFNPAKLADDVVVLFRQTCPEEKKNRLEINLTIEEGFPESAQGDPTRLRQVLVNLVGNAVKFTHRGSVDLICSQRDNRLLFDVKDTGIGIDAYNLERIFEEFTQADASVSREYHGTGLGLTICNKLLHLMEGTVTVESSVGVGSCFHVEVPYKAAREPVVTEEPKDTHFTKALDCLVVEDVSLNQKIIGAMLEKVGHRAVMADNGLEALDILEKQDFDVILMDIRMPVMSGTAATEKIRRMSGPKASIPIIALTADVMEENRQSYFDAGMNECVAKPIDRAQLMAAIKRVCPDA